MSEPSNQPAGGGFGRRRFVLGAAVAGTAIAAVKQARAHAAPHEPSPGRMTRRKPPARQLAVVGNTVPAFPGCEGAGKFTTGGRGGEVYEVTTLAESGPGSLREAVSGSNRIVVFRVGGTIELTSGIDITGNNITIAGQTAPGDGIAITGNEFAVKADNVIIRYLRVRAGDRLGTGIDTFNGRGHRNIVVDHCSVSWGVDECFSLYGNYDVTVSNCIISEGLSMSRHDKGLHGYGGLWGGQNVSYYNNLLIHQGGRNPRFSFTEDMEQRVDHRNNVIVNYGYTSCYGGEWAEGVNVAGNYYQPGPATLAEIAPHVLEPYRGGSWYVAGNKVVGHPDVTEDNTRGIDVTVGGINLLTEPAPISVPLPDDQTADDAYQTVLNGVGASLPHYDSVDTRLLNDVRDGTGRLINSQIEVGGYPVLKGAKAPVDTDQDGIPDAWETENGLDPENPADAGEIGPHGYSNLENYLNSISTDVVGYPTVRITSPAADAVLPGETASQSLTITADASPVNGTKITAVEFYVNETMIGKATSAPYRVTWTPAPVGTWYLTAKAIDDQGAQTQSTGTPVHLTRTSATRPWRSRDIGEVKLAGSDFIDSVTGDITITGAGKISGGTDAFHYLYQPITAGPNDVVEIIGRIDDLSRVWSDVFAGFMFRETLEPDSPYFTAGLKVTDEGLKGHVNRIRSFGTEPSLSDYPWDEDELLDIEPHWIRLIKRGTEFEAHLGPDSLQWTRIGYERIPMADKLYVGLAIDAGKQDNAIHHYARATYHRVRLGL